VIAFRGERVIGYAENPHPAEVISVAVRPDVRVVGGGSLSVHDLALLKKWIELNREVLVRYWDGEIEYTEEAIASLEPIR
jgi:hypothetical protein